MWICIYDIQSHQNSMINHDPYKVINFSLKYFNNSGSMCIDLHLVDNYAVN